MKFKYELQLVWAPSVQILVSGKQRESNDPFAFLNLHLFNLYHILNAAFLYIRVRYVIVITIKSFSPVEFDYSCV